MHKTHIVSHSPRNLQKSGKQTQASRSPSHSGTGSKVSATLRTLAASSRKTDLVERGGSACLSIMRLLHSEYRPNSMIKSYGALLLMLFLNGRNLTPCDVIGNSFLRVLLRISQKWNASRQWMKQCSIVSGSLHSLQFTDQGTYIPFIAIAIIWTLSADFCRRPSCPGYVYVCTYK